MSRRHSGLRSTRFAGGAALAAEEGDLAHRVVEHGLVVVPDAGHASNQDNQAAFNAALLAFLDRAVPPARTGWSTPARTAG